MRAVWLGWRATHESMCASREEIKRASLLLVPLFFFRRRFEAGPRQRPPSNQGADQTKALTPTNSQVTPNPSTARPRGPPLGPTRPSMQPDGARSGTRRGPGPSNAAPIFFFSERPDLFSKALCSALQPPIRILDLRSFVPMPYALFEPDRRGRRTVGARKLHRQVMERALPRNRVDSALSGPSEARRST